LGPFEFVYWLGYRLDRYMGRKKAKSLPVSVISIGNLTLGGTGKTPLAISLSLKARERGINSCVLTRGYKGNLKGPVLVRPEMSAKDVGDEALLIAKKGIAVVKCPDRYEAGLYALRNLHPAPDLFIMDDGYQHWRLKRDLDILLLNGVKPFGKGKMLPVGDLREPIKEIKRAGIIVLTKCERITDALQKEIREHNPNAPLYSAPYEPLHIADANGKTYPLEWLRGKEVMAFCGIGEPSSFKETLTRAGAVVKGFRAFGDHHRYTPADTLALARKAKKLNVLWILTTEKDIMRLAGGPFHALAAGLKPPEAFYDEVFGKIAEAR